MRRSYGVVLLVVFALAALAATAAAERGPMPGPWPERGFNSVGRNL